MGNKTALIVEEQIKAWSLQNSLGRSERTYKKHFPVITISREFGARGAALAEVLGHKTGFKVWNDELLRAIAEESGSNKKLLEQLDERLRQAVGDAFAGFFKNLPTNTSYLRSLIYLVKTIEEQGSEIIVGRGANYICENPLSFHVRVVCPLDSRIAGYAERENLTKEDAREIVEQRDRERAEFIKFNFYRNISTPSDYDLLINSDTFSLEQMAGIVLEAYEAKIGQRTMVKG
jgi:hypothetical protein